MSFCSLPPEFAPLKPAFCNQLYLSVFQLADILFFLVFSLGFQLVGILTPLMFSLSFQLPIAKQMACSHIYTTNPNVLSVTPVHNRNDTSESERVQAM